MVFSPDSDDVMLGTAAPARHHYDDDELIGGSSTVEDGESDSAGDDVINEDLGSLDDLLSQVVRREDGLD